MDKNSLIIIPYRDRLSHLLQIIPAIRKFTQHDILVVEQCDKGDFNRGAICNIGFKEHGYKYDNIIVHDVDALSVNVDYSYSNLTCLLATHVQQFNYTLPYKFFLGCVTIFPTKAFVNVSGFSNKFEYWGAEDDEIRHQLRNKQYDFTSRECWFDSLSHPHANEQSPQVRRNRQLLREMRVNGRDRDDGLNSVRYLSEFATQMPEYLHIGISLI